MAYTTLYIDDLVGVKHEALRRSITLRKLVNLAIKKYLKEVPYPPLPKDQIAPEKEAVPPTQEAPEKEAVPPTQEAPEKEAVPPYRVPEREAAHQDQEVPEKKPCTKAE